MSTSETVGSGVAPPEPDLTPEEMVARAEALRPKLIADQEATEKRTYYSQEMHEAFLAAGFYHLYVRGATAAMSSTCRPTWPSSRRSRAGACRPRGAWAWR
ncbi:MAG TPA: hypothetical protein VMB27_24870 [Solirubrobacteraceae bacterium]|nr:hypothetical protein [Solirubrobacteraceae bacterium]